VLLDEPTAHLDPVSAAELDSAIGTLMAGRTVIWITHNAGAVPGSARRLVLCDGVAAELDAIEPNATEPDVIEPGSGQAGLLVQAAPS
jgi:ABC-type transport system involved in cytochrome bd biosynthesis fused ATPase/permease subunit